MSEQDMGAQLPQPINDTWLSGKPFYCKLCGLGMGEYMACEEPDCELESEGDALGRLQRETDKRASAQPQGNHSSARKD